MSLWTPVQRTLAALSLLVITMGALGWAAVPFYNWFCRVTGYGGTTGVAEAGSDVVLDKTIRIRFDSSLERGMAWEFRPAQREMELKIGETGLAFYEAYNPTDRVIAGTASYNVAPYSAGSYFIKIDCFCFTQQVLHIPQLDALKDAIAEANRLRLELDRRTRADETPKDS